MESCGFKEEPRGFAKCETNLMASQWVTSQCLVSPIFNIQLSTVKRISHELGAKF